MPEPIPHSLNVDHAETIAAAIDDGHPALDARDRMILALEYEEGLRRIKVTRMRVADVDERS